MTRAEVKEVVLVPCVAWAGLMLAVVFTTLYANLPNGPQKPAVALGVASLQAFLSALVFMRLGKASTLVRLTAAVGFLWLSFLFIFAFADYLTRPYPM